MSGKIILRKKNEIPLDINSNMLLYGLNGSGKTRVLKLIYKYHNQGIEVYDLDDDIEVSSLKETSSYEKKQKSYIKDIYDGFKLIDSIIKDEYAMIISSSERREFEKMYNHIDRINKSEGNKFVSIAYLRELKRIMKYQEYNLRYLSGFDSRLFEPEDKILPSLFIKYINILDIENLEELSRQSRMKAYKVRKIKGEKKVYFIGVEKSPKIIDEIVKSKQNSFSKIVKFNNFKKGKELPINEITRFYHELNQKISEINSEFKKYFKNNISFDIDFDTWQWSIKKDSVVYPYENLSSGENNIIIILISIALLEVDLLILDEPEISFSENYTMHFNESLAKLKNNSMNILIATHSYYIFENYPGIKQELKLEKYDV